MQNERLLQKDGAKLLQEDWGKAFAVEFTKTDETEGLRAIDIN